MGICKGIGKEKIGKIGVDCVQQVLIHAVFVDMRFKVWINLALPVFRIAVIN